MESPDDANIVAGARGRGSWKAANVMTVPSHPQVLCKLPLDIMELLAGVTDTL